VLGYGKPPVETNTDSEVTSYAQTPAGYCVTCSLGDLVTGNYAAASAGAAPDGGGPACRGRSIYSGISMHQ
jgi:hypothetical protein